MKIQESGENYLEAILLLEDEKHRVRAVDIANALGVSKPSVTRAMGVLKKAGYIVQESYGDISLTEEGRRRAGDVPVSYTHLDVYKRQHWDGVSADPAQTPG